MEAASLIYPTGELREEWFEGEDLTTTLEAFLAEVSSESEAKQESWAYYRAYDDIATRLAIHYSPYRVDLVTEGVRPEQYGYFAAKARKHLAAYNATSVRSRMVDLTTRF